MSSVGGMFGLQAGLDQMKAASRLITEATPLNSSGNGGSTAGAEGALNGFAERVNKENQQVLDMAKMKYESGGNIDIYAWFDVWVKEKDWKCKNFQSFFIWTFILINSIQNSSTNKNLGIFVYENLSTTNKKRQITIIKSPL